MIKIGGDSGALARSEYFLRRVRYVEEAVGAGVFAVRFRQRHREAEHRSVVDQQVESLRRPDSHSVPDYREELRHGYFLRDEEFRFVQVRKRRFFGEPLNDDLEILMFCYFKEGSRR